MRAAVLRAGEIVVDDIGELTPGTGQVLVETVACGICGTDLHARRHADTFVAASRACAMALFDWDTSRDIVMGHEFTARIIELGAGIDSSVAAAGVKPGQLVVGHPMVRVDGRACGVGYSNDYPGGYAQRMLLDPAGLIALPDSADPVAAALTEPMAVGMHAVNRSQVAQTRSAIVLGCGPVGLATIAALHHAGTPLVVASDFSPARRALAARLGAHVVVDSNDDEPVAAWRSAGGRGPTVIFDAVGVPGVIEGAMVAAPRHSQILVVGLCMPKDQIWPAVGINKELTISFVLGWTPDEFSTALQAIVEGTVDVTPFITGHVDLDGVAGAFDELADPERHVKVVVHPNGWR